MCDLERARERGRGLEGGGHCGVQVRGKEEEGGGCIVWCGLQSSRMTDDATPVLNLYLRISK